MSVLKKVIPLILLVIAVILFWLMFIPDEPAVPDFSSENKIELLSKVLANRYANDIREAGYGIPTDSAIRRIGGIDHLEILDEVNLTVRVPSPEDDELLILFSTIINNKETDVAFFLNKEFNLIDSSYDFKEEDGTIKKVEIDASQEKELLEQVQKELNQFLERMKERLDSK